MLYVLYEHAVGYALFEVTEFEEIGSFLPQVEQSVTDLSRFNKIVKLAAFVAFESALDALESINSVSEGKSPLLLYFVAYLRISVTETCYPL